MSSKHLALAFKAWDTQKTGYITPQQLRHLMEQGGYPAGISKADMEELIEFADADHDGKLSFKEYV